MITKEIKEKWLAALRSGKYNKGTQQLRNYDQFCCLGVLADVINPDGWVYNNWHLNPDDSLCSVNLPQKILDEQEHLIKANDNEEHRDINFDDVIPLIEQIETL